MFEVAEKEHAIKFYLDFSLLLLCTVAADVLFIKELALRLVR